MIQVVVDTPAEYKAVTHAMELPSLGDFEYGVSYRDPNNAPKGEEIGSGRTHNEIVHGGTGSAD